MVKAVLVPVVVLDMLLVIEPVPAVLWLVPILELLWGYSVDTELKDPTVPVPEPEDCAGAV